jgi:hypothetical protein
MHMIQNIRESEKGCRLEIHNVDAVAVGRVQEWGKEMRYRNCEKVKWDEWEFAVSHSSRVMNRPPILLPNN